MNTTLFLAQIYGPILLCMGLGIFISKNYYRKIYRDLEKDVLAVFLFGMIGMAIGIVQIRFHNVWNTIPQILISIIGWGFLLKGILFTVWPRQVDKAGDYWASKHLIPLSGTLLLLIGAYLSWFAYFV